MSSFLNNWMAEDSSLGAIGISPLFHPMRPTMSSTVLLAQWSDAIRSLAIRTDGSYFCCQKNLFSLQFFRLLQITVRPKRGIS